MKTELRLCQSSVQRLGRKSFVTNMEGESLRKLQTHKCRNNNTRPTTVTTGLQLHVREFLKFYSLVKIRAARPCSTQEMLSYISAF